MKILKRNVKKIISSLLLIITIFSTMFTNLQMVFAATGNYISRIYETEFEDNIGSKIFKIRVQGDDIPALKESGFGQVAFCLNHHMDHPETYTDFNKSTDFTTDADFVNSARLAFLGYYRYSNADGNAKQSETGRNDSTQYAYTALTIWQKLGQVPDNYSLGSDFNTFKSELMDEFNKWNTLPSFNGSTQTLEIGQSSKIKDTNGVLKYYESFNYTKDGVTFKHTKGSDDLELSVSQDISTDSVLLSATDAKNHNMGKYINKTPVKTNFVLTPLSSDKTHQRFIVSYGYNDPKYLSLTVSVNLFGRLELKKLGSNGELLDGAVFQVTGPDNYNQTVTVDRGEIVLENLKPGTYSITEKTAPEGYILDTKTYRVEVKANETATQTITNNEPTGTFTLTKYNSDKSAKITGVKYHIWNDNEYSQDVLTDSNGTIKVEGLKL